MARATAALQYGFFQNTQPQPLLKWIGNKHRIAPQIISFIPPRFNNYIEPFVGTGAVLGALMPSKALAGDSLKPLIELWNLIKHDPKLIIEYYSGIMEKYLHDPNFIYKQVKDSYNTKPNAFDLLFLSRSCYGGVVRFTKSGSISTPRGPHKPIAPEVFASRVYDWRQRILNTTFIYSDFRETMSSVTYGDVVYCDPPYIHSQSILYGAQSFSITSLWQAIEGCVERGAKVLLSIDGVKKSGKEILSVDYPKELFKRELLIDVGMSMLRRFQKEGEDMKGEKVHDRLLLTW